MKRTRTAFQTLLGVATVAWSAVAISLADDVAPIRVALVTYGAGKATDCFSDGFLALVDRDSHLSVQRTLDRVDLADAALFEHPMIVMTGYQDYKLTDAQAENLRTFLRRGGFLLASSLCAREPFDEAFRRMMARVLPEVELQPLPADHALLSMLYEVDRVVTVRPTKTPLWAATLDGRVAVLYSPVSLNDSSQLGEACCCCGANDIRNARQINANALVYAVTH